MVIKAKLLLLSFLLLMFLHDRVHKSIVLNVMVEDLYIQKIRLRSEME